MPGHSLGAHISGYAGRTFTEITNKTLPRITGLDPARPCFNEGERLSGLQRGDAAFVDIIHSNAGVLGVKEPIGDVDFFPNGWVIQIPKAMRQTNRTKLHFNSRRLNFVWILFFVFVFSFFLFVSLIVVNIRCSRVAGPLSVRTVVHMNSMRKLFSQGAKWIY